MPAALSLIQKRKAQSRSAFVDNRVSESKKVQRRSVVSGRVVGRDSQTGEYRVQTGDGNHRHARSVASSDIVGKSVNVTVNSKIGQIAGMPGFT